MGTIPIGKARCRLERAVTANERNIARQLKLVGPDSEAAGSRGVGTGDLGRLRRNNAAER